MQIAYRRRAGESGLAEICEGILVLAESLDQGEAIWLPRAKRSCRETVGRLSHPCHRSASSSDGPAGQDPPAILSLALQGTCVTTYFALAQERHLLESSINSTYIVCQEA